MTVRLRAAIVALAAALTCGLLGSSVSEKPPAGIDLAGRALAGHFAHVALVFTASCWWYVLLALGVAALAFAVLVRAWRGRVIFSVVTTLVAWQASDAMKSLFARSRPEYWVLHHETSWSYPSGHAMFAVMIYGLWSYYIATSAMPQPWRNAIATLVALWGAAVIWSRLALGAHFVTDVIGGVLLGITMLAVATAVVPHIAFSPRSGARFAGRQR